MRVRRALLSHMHPGAKYSADPTDADPWRPPAWGPWRRRAIRGWSHRFARRFRNSAARPYLLAVALCLAILLTLAAAVSILRQEVEERHHQWRDVPPAGASR